MYFLTARLRGDKPVHHIATHRTKAHRCIHTPVIKVGATTSSRYHPYLPSCGYTIGPDGDTLNLYYGAADSCMAVARANLGEFLDGLDQRGGDPTLGAR